MGRHNSRAAIIMALFITAAFIISGCSGGGGGGGSTASNPTGDPGGTPAPTDEDLIREDITNNSNGLFGLETSDAAETDYNKKTTGDKEDAEPHQRWYREYTSRTANINVDIVGDLADVTIVRNWYGTFHVKPDPEGDPVEKPMNDVLSRYAQYERVDGEWRIKAVSPLVMQSTGENYATIKSFRITSEDGTVEYLNVTDPTALFNVEDLPVFTPDTNIRVETEVEYNGESIFTPPQYVFVHHGARMAYTHHRRIAFDDGGTSPFSGDLTEGDNIFTRLYKTGPGSRYWKRGSAGTINAAALHTTDDDYQSNVWVIPYHVVEAQE